MSERFGVYSVAHFKVEAAYDRESGVWYVCESNVPGLATEAASLDELAEKLAIMIPDLTREAHCECSYEASRT